MSRRSVDHLFSVTLFVFIGCVLFGASDDHLHAQEIVAKSSQTESFAYRRVFVPADSPETWPVGSERYLPIPRTEFSKLVEQQKDYASIEKHQIPIHVRSAIYRAALSSNEVLTGEAEWSIELAQNESSEKVSRLLSLSPFNLAIESAIWRDSKQAALVGLWAHNHRTSELDNMELAVLAHKSDTLLFDWQLPARRMDAEYTEFNLQVPNFVPQQLEISLPPNRSATLSTGQLLQTDVGPLGESRWVFQLAVRDSHRIRIQRLAPKDTSLTRPLVSQANSYELEPAGLKVLTRLRLDARDSEATELFVAIASGMKIVEVKIDQQRVAWRVANSNGRSRLAIPFPNSQQPQIVEIQSLAKFRDSVTWELPKLQFEDVTWTEGTTSLLVSQDLEVCSLMPRQSTLQHIVGIADNNNEGEVFRLQEWDPEAALVIEVGRPAERITVQKATSIELDRDEAKATVIALFSNSGRDAYQVQATVAPGWSIDSVTTKPKSALNEWHIDRNGNSSKLRFQLNQPISEQSPLSVEIQMRETTGKPILPATVRQLNLLRFQDVEVAEDAGPVLHLKTRKAKQLALPDRLEKYRLPLDVVRELLPNASAGTMIDISELSEDDLIEFRQRPAEYEVDLNVEIEALADTIQHLYDVTIRMQAGAVSEIVLEFDEPLPKTLQWRLVEQNRIVVSERIDAEATDGAHESRNATYRILFPVALTEDFHLQASYSLPAQSTEQCNLVRIPQSIDWMGQVQLYGLLEAFHILDQGWTSTVSSLSSLDREQLPLLGAYRLGPEELRRGKTTSRLSLKRRQQEPTTSHLVAWLAEFGTLQAANGEAIHSATYSLENLNVAEGRLTLPDGAELQEAWLDDQQLEEKEISYEDNVYSFRFDKEQRWPCLILKYSTSDSTLGGSSSIRPVIPTCSFPVNLSRWTLWAPEQYVIDNTQQDYSSQRNHWWKRVFGPLARSRGETVFNPVRSAGWAQIWSAPLEIQQTRKIAEAVARKLADRVDSANDQTWESLLAEVAKECLAEELLYVDRSALLAKGIKTNSLLRQLSSSAPTPSRDTQAIPLSSYRLAILASPGMILLTTTDRVAQWHDQLHPAESPGVFLLSSDDLADRFDEIRGARSSAIVNIAQWINSPVFGNTRWVRHDTTNLADIGRQARTVEFVDAVPTLVVRRAFVKRGLWYAVILLTIVVGVWQFAHYPNAMVLFAALAAAVCLIVPTNWITIPQAVFLGLVAAAMVRIALKSTHFGKDRLLKARPQLPSKVAMTSLLFLASCLYSVADAQTNEPIDLDGMDLSLPVVLLPIDSDGKQQGDDIYLPEKLLEKLQLPRQEIDNGGAELAILNASYRGKISNAFGNVPEGEAPILTDPWVLSWKVKSYLPNRRLHLPLRREEAIWDSMAHRLDGAPVQLDWQQDGVGCSIDLPSSGIHLLQLVCRPRLDADSREARLSLHVPLLPGAMLNLERGQNISELQVDGASLIPKSDSDSASLQEFALGAQNVIDLCWKSEASQVDTASWERFEQLSWLQIDPAAAWLDVQLSIQGLQSDSLVLQLDASAQLQLVTPDETSPIAEVIAPSSGLSKSIELKLRPGIPSDLVIPLRFELQRAASVGHISFPQVRLKGLVPDQNLFAVSVAGGLSYDEQVSYNVRSIEPTEFSSAWKEAEQAPLYAYALGSEAPEWSLRVWPDPQSLSAQQTLRMHCLASGASVDYEASIDSLTGNWLSHRLQVPASMRIDKISVHSQAETNPIPARWSRVSDTGEVVIFLGRSLQQPHVVRMQGHLAASSEKEIELPQVQILGGQQSEVHLDLYRAENVSVSWSETGLIPKEIDEQRVSRVGKEIHVGHFSWRSSRDSDLARLRLKENVLKFESASVITTKLGIAGWTAQLNSRLKVRQGVLSRLSITVPDNFKPPYIVSPEQIGEIDEIRETPNGQEITLLLSRPFAKGSELEIRLGGNVSLQADRHLVVPSLQWNGAVRRDRFVLLPKSIDGQLIDWRRSGLRRESLPVKLNAFATNNDATLSYRIEQSQFEAEERTHSLAMLNALVRSAKVSGKIDNSGILIATAELVLQPGRATTCSIKLPPHTQLRQLVVGDRAVRRELLENGSWKVPLGPPLMPQRIVVSYCSQHRLETRQLMLVPPEILLGENKLPTPPTWWHIVPTSGLQIRKLNSGRQTNEIQFLKVSYLSAASVIKDALSPALELPLQEGQAWFQTWHGVRQQAKADWQAYGLSPEEKAEILTKEQDSHRFTEAFGSKAALTTQFGPLTYPPRVPLNIDESPAQKGFYFVSDSQGKMSMTISLGSQTSLRRWLAAFALVTSVLAAAIKLRQSPQWHHKLCHWPHSLALGGGLIWWLLLKPSVLGMLVVVLASVSLAIRQWRRYRSPTHYRPVTQLAVPPS